MLLEWHQTSTFASLKFEPWSIHTLHPKLSAIKDDNFCARRITFEFASLTFCFASHYRNKGVVTRGACSNSIKSHSVLIGARRWWARTRRHSSPAKCVRTRMARGRTDRQTPGKNRPRCKCNSNGCIANLQCSVLSQRSTTQGVGLAWIRARKRCADGRWPASMQRGLWERSEVDTTSLRVRRDKRIEWLLLNIWIL